MAIESVARWHPKLALPLYTKITHPRRNDYQIGTVYEVRIEDPDRAKERGQHPPFNYIHESLLIHKEEMDLDDIPDILLAFDTGERSRESAYDSIIHDDGRVVFLVFLRLDKAKGVVTDGLEAVHKELTKEATEDTNMEGRQ